MPNIFHQPLSKYPIWYHGTNLISAQGIINNGIQFNHRNIKFKINNQSNKYRTYDFGPGFYLTQNKDQAIQWAKSHSNYELPFLKPALIKMNLTKFFDHVHIKRLDNFNIHFMKYVLYCRLSGSFYKNPNNYYSAVFGHVADGKIKKFVQTIRDKYSANPKNVNKILKDLNYSHLKKKLEINRFRKDNQLCLIDKNAIIKYIDIRDTNKNLEVL